MTNISKLKTIVALALGATMLSGTAFAQDVTMRFAHHLPESSEQHIAAERFAEIVEDKSGGSISVEVLPGGQLGGQREIIESVQLGTLEMGYGESGLYANYVPAYGILTLPYLYDDPAHWQNVVTGDIGNGLNEQLEEATGLVVLNWIQAGYRDTFTTEKVIQQPSDFEGLKIRVPESPVFVETFSTLNAQPTPIPFPEVYTAMQTGVVGAMEGTPEAAYTNNIYEVAKHYNKTRHIFFDGSFVTSRQFLDTLTEDQQTIVTEAALEVAQQQRDEWAGRQDEWDSKLAETGIEIHEMDLEPFREALSDLQDKFAEQAGATDLIGEIRSASGE
ncbi:TRAP transporter substrate-binding protein [Fulvimarina sp. MAC8]|uniref:TRAP transporter substrate-binding protein n=1 Tax=Fulvimarina sp. MAC8 TaxID=3162874 RepID=UPI0032EDF54F